MNYSKLKAHALKIDIVKNALWVKGWSSAVPLLQDMPYTEG